MTLLASWAAVDTHGTSSVYIAADSRITTLVERDEVYYDFARKVYACKNSPDIFGYCGDVLFPSMALSQLVEMADAGLLFPRTATCSEKFESFSRQLIILHNSYIEISPEDTTFEVIHASRSPDGRTFECELLRWTVISGFTRERIDMPKTSDTLFVRGIGVKAFRNNYEKYKQGATAGTSRSVFHCFYETLTGQNETRIGGSPQLVGLVRKPNMNGIQYGMAICGKRYYLGTELGLRTVSEGVQWRNELFEICNEVTGIRKDNAQPQPNPHSLSASSSPQSLHPSLPVGHSGKS